ncbi:protein S100-A10 [Latimeria chalumnae]|uniref:Protein S100-A10 n=1 Tax=Latimeria chalumnae TaxID=7897 RepID=H3A3I9_LATCH|nr:PREDICTED: protein S100-A10-like [Latimeria chalumnae]|eukprot:XP_006013209.1 PREDICTED: protein S100-A10-like [Latimeria chalumnae]
MPSKTEIAMETLITSFHEFSGDKNYLTKDEFKSLLEKEFCGLLENQKNPNIAIDYLLREISQSRDDLVSFQEYFNLLAGLTIACNTFYGEEKKKGVKM